MKPPDWLSVRRILGLLILLVSLILLIWGLWPFQTISQSIPLQPVDLQLPMPDSFLPLIPWIV